MSVPRGANTANQRITRLCTVTGDIQLLRNSRVFGRYSARETVNDTRQRSDGSVREIVI